MVTVPRTTLLTGGSGFIGQYVLRGLLLRGERVVVMLREAAPANHMRLVQIMAPLGIAVDPYVANGQLVLAQGWLPEHLPLPTWGPTDQIIHSAACLQVENDGQGEPFATNVEGVKAIAEWASLHDVSPLHFVSTAYTCGRDATTAHEVFHTPRPRFVTDYEYSKWLAEEFLLEWSSRTGRCLTILRPSLVVGDSSTGHTTQFGGFYQLARMVEVLRGFYDDGRPAGGHVLPLRIPARPEGRQNLVPVDYAARVIVELVLRPDLHGHIYHITNPSPPTNHQVKEWYEEYYQVSGGHFVDRVDRSRSESPAEDLFLQLSELILQQMDFVPEFDCSNTRRALAGCGILPPRFDGDLVFTLLNYARAHHWGRRVQAAAS